MVHTLRFLNKSLSSSRCKPEKTTRKTFGRVEERFPGPEKFTRKEPRKVFGPEKFSGLLRKAGCYQSLTRASRSSAREGERLGTIHIRKYSNGCCSLKKTAQFNFQVIVLSKQSNLERSALYLIILPASDDQFAFVERFEQ